MSESIRMAGAGNIILLVVSLVGCVIWSGIYLMFACHYFLTTIIDSSAGNEEVNYDTEPFFDRWWKPLFCLWILLILVTIGSVLLVPCMIRQPLTLAILVALLVWVLYPLGILSALSGHWYFVLDVFVIAKLLRLYQAYAYVQGLTLLGAAVCVLFLWGVFGHSLLWALPASLVLPTVLLFYSRLWGRYAWFALNFTPKKKKKKRKQTRSAEIPMAMHAPPEHAVPEMEVEIEEMDEEVDPGAEGIQEGLPPVAPPTTAPPAFTDDVPASIPSEPPGENHLDLFSLEGIQAGEPPAWPLPAPSASSATSTPSLPLPPGEDEEEDEWSKNKKPYGLAEEPPVDPPSSLPAYARESDADKPISLVEHYDEQIEKERQRQEKQESATHLLPRPRMTSAFQVTMVHGVWEFMLQARTIQAWINLVVLTLIELALLSMVVRFWPASD